nr:MAG: ORF1 [TTV-like mini virus]
MPYFWRRPWYRRRYHFRRPWYRSRRPRTTFRRRRRRWVRKRFYYTIPKTIRLRQWNPRTTRLCKIKGHLPLIICGRDRQIFNWMQYYDSIGPAEQSGGGGWSSIVFSLGALYQQFKRLMNWWTKDNDGLPLVQYKGCKFKFYKSWDCDYIVTAQTCPPMTDTEYRHLDSHPYRQLMNKRPIIVPNLVRKPSKKTYKIKRFPPPSLLQNKWYFQQDFCATNLLMLTTSAASFDQFWLPNDEVSQVITFYSLNTKIFANANFHTMDTQGYKPKNTYILWGTGNGTTTKPTTYGKLHYLANTNQYTLGQDWTESFPPEKGKWGNPFYHDHSSIDTKIYYSTSTPTSASTPTSNPAITESDHIYITCRYNPLKDTGEGNQVFFKSTSISKNPIYEPENNPDIHISGFPLWLIFWGWTDWLEKKKPINQIYLNYYIVIISDFIEPKLPGYVILDQDFIVPDTTALTETDKNYWHPRWAYQKKTANRIGISGPCTPKLNKAHSIQVNAFYTFYFKFGGCPAPMQNIKDPCEQPKFPVPSDQLQTIQIIDPATDKQSLLHDFDERRQTITETATKRIKKAKDSKTPIFTDLLNPPIQEEETSQDSSEEEAHPSQNITQQLLNIRRRRLKLLRKLQLKSQIL